MRVNKWRQLYRHDYANAVCTRYDSFSQQTFRLVSALQKII